MCKAVNLQVFYHPSGLLDGEASSLKALLSKIGGVVAQMPAQNIVMVARAGSYIYNLATSESDVDYVVVYKEPIKVKGDTGRRSV